MISPTRATAASKPACTGSEIIAHLAKDLHILLIYCPASRGKIIGKFSRLRTNDEQHPDYQWRKKFAHSNDQLNDTLTEVAESYLRDAGHDVKSVRAESEHDVKAEVQNFLWADVVIWQMPGWWMGAPWTVKKYMDDVFTEGHGSLYASDGRTRPTPAKIWLRRPGAGEKYMSPDLERADGSLHRRRPVLPRRRR